MDERLPGWRLAIVATLLSAFVSLGFSIASVVVPSLIVPGADRAMVGPFAGYALSRSVAIAVAAVVVSLDARARRTGTALLAVGWIATAVQVTDVIVGLQQADVVKSAGPAVLAAFSAYALLRFGKARSANSAR